MAIDLNKAKIQKEHQLLPDALLPAKEVGAMTGVSVKRIYDSVDSGIIKTHSIVKKGDGIRDFMLFDGVNVVEVSLIKHTSAFGIPKRTIKDFFHSIRYHRDSLNPFKIDAYNGIAYLCFVYDENGEIKFLFLDDQTDENLLKLDKLKGHSVYFVVNLSELVKSLFMRVESL